MRHADAATPLERDGLSALDDVRGMYAFAWWTRPTARCASRATRGASSRSTCSTTRLVGSRFALSSGRCSCSKKPDVSTRSGRTVRGVRSYRADTDLLRAHTESPARHDLSLAFGGERSDRRGSLDQEILPWQSTAEWSVTGAVQDSVRAHLVADVEVGIFLSGGIDSTLLAACARGRTLACVRLRFPFPACRPSTRVTSQPSNAREIGVDHCVVPVTASGMVRALDRFLATAGEPFGDAAALALTVL